MGTFGLRLSGSGGQGLLLAGIVLAEAAIFEGKNAVQTQSYGPEARGGASKSEVIISDEAILFPKVQRADLVLALTQSACDKYAGTVDPDGLLIIDDSIVLNESIQVRKIARVPILESAKTVIGKPIVANIIAIGVITELTGLVSKKMLEEAILSRVPRGTENLNKSALSEGYRIAKSVK